MSRKPVALLLAAACMLLACAEKDRALDSILESGTVRVITRNNAHCFYTYRGQDMGLEHDLAQAFADFLGVQLVLTVAESKSELLRSLDEGKGDIGAAGIAITPSRSDKADFSRPYLTVEQVVVTHRTNTKLRTVEDLAGRTVYVRPGTPHEESLRALKREGLSVTVRRHRGLSAEELIRAVAEEKLEAAMADSHVALLNRRYYPDVRIAFSIGESHPIGWAVRKGEKALLAKINEFFEILDQDGRLDEFYKRHHAYVDRFDHLDIKRFIQRVETRLPQYQNAIEEAAEEYGFDWRLIAALVYQESQFNPWARSFAGAKGLMQLTQDTARAMGVKNRLNPIESIRGGVKYLKKLHNLYDRASEPDRTLIALAAYNVGKAHIIDARQIAKRKNLDPNKWSSLEKTLPLLRLQRYHEKSTYGYCRGGEPVILVRNILTYYDILKRRAIRYTYED